MDTIVKTTLWGTAVDSLNANFTEVAEDISELSEKNGVFASLSSQADTTVTTAGTYYPIAGTFTNTPIENFTAGTVVTPSIKYSGTETKYFEIDWHTTVIPDRTGTIVHLGIKKGTSLIASSVMGTFLKTALQAQALSGTCVVSLATDDEIQLVLTADGNGDVITVQHYTTTIKPFFF